jgi:hypothetical protein
MRKQEKKQRWWQNLNISFIKVLDTLNLDKILARSMSNLI